MNCMKVQLFIHLQEFRLLSVVNEALEIVLLEFMSWIYNSVHRLDTNLSFDLINQ